MLTHRAAHHLGRVSSVRAVPASGAVLRPRLVSSSAVPTAAGKVAGMMTLYDYPLAFNPAKARLMFAEKGTPHKTELVNLFGGDNLTPGYLRLNPAGTAPTLVVGSQVFVESLKVLQHVDGCDGLPLGGTAVDRPFVEEWVQQVDGFDGNLFIAAQGPGAVRGLLGQLYIYSKNFAERRMKENPTMREVYTKKLDTMKKAQDQMKDPAAVSSNKSQLLALLDRAEERLTRSTYLAGNSYSIADVIFTPVLYRIGQVGKKDEFLKPRPKVSRYFELLQSRPSYKATFGPQENPLYAGSLVVPALAKVALGRLFNWY